MQRNRYYFVERYATALLAVVSLCIAIAGLMPFSFFPANRAAFGGIGQGLHFLDPSIAFTTGPIFPFPPRDISIELVIRPDRDDGYRNAPLATFLGRETQLFSLSQWKSMLIMRTGEMAGDRKGQRGIAGVFKKDAVRLLALTSDAAGTRVYLDGKLLKRFTSFSLVPSESELSGPIVLGNAPEGKNSWSGSILALSVYGRTLGEQEVLDHFRSWQETGSIPQRDAAAAYLFEHQQDRRVKDLSRSGNDLQVPLVFYPIRKTILHLPLEGNLLRRSSLTDIGLNIIGFLPFGFLTREVLRGRSAGLRLTGAVVVLALLVSLFIELVQVYIPLRDSSILDVLCNGSGAYGGTLLHQLYLPPQHKILGAA